MDPAETADFYELVVERHLESATPVTFNRDLVGWLAALADLLLAESAIDRLPSAAGELIVEDEPYRGRQKHTLTNHPTTNPTTRKEQRR